MWVPTPKDLKMSFNSARKSRPEQVPTLQLAGGRSRVFPNGDNGGEGDNNNGPPTRMYGGPTRKTPLALLNEMCSKDKATAVFRLIENPHNMERDQQIFQYYVQVSTKLQNYTGIGKAFSKRNAKQAAARNVMLKMDPEFELMLTPDLDHRQQEDYHEREVKSPTLISQFPSNQCQLQRSEEYVVTREVMSESTDEISYDKSITKQVKISTKMEDNYQLLISIDLSELNDGEQQKIPSAAAMSISLKEKVGIVQGWVGQKIKWLEGLYMERIDGLNDPVDVAEKITAEQNLKLEFVCLKEDGNDWTIYNCMMEVSQVVLDEESSLDVFEHPIIHFTEFATANSADEAKKSAARKFLKMICMILNSNIIG